MSVRSFWVRTKYAWRSPWGDHAIHGIVLLGGLIACAILFLGLFLIIPLLTVFAKALEDGIGVYLSSITETDALAALRLTLLTTFIVVPLNMIFGLAAGWALRVIDPRSVQSEILDACTEAIPVLERAGDKAGLVKALTLLCIAAFLAIPLGAITIVLLRWMAWSEALIATALLGPRRLLASR